MTGKRTTTYKGDPALREELVERARAHADADRLVQNFGYFGPVEIRSGTTSPRLTADDVGEWKGCGIGCLATPANGRAPAIWRRITSRRSAASKLRREFGIPESLTAACESVFESLRWPAARDWPARFAEAVPVGVDARTLDLRWRDQVPGTLGWYGGGSPWLRPGVRPSVARDELLRFLRSQEPAE